MVLDALNTYGGLQEIKEALKDTSSEVKNREKRLEILKGEIKALEEQKASIKDALTTYHKLRDQGFDRESLNELMKSTELYGSVRRVLEAVNTYTTLKRLQTEVKEIEDKKKSIESEFKKAQADHAHQQTVLGLCETLLYKYSFSVPAIDDLLKTAKIYGDPLEVLKAIGRYGETRKIESEIHRLEARKADLTARIDELDKQIMELRGTADEIKRSLKGVLTPITREVSKNTDALRRKFEEAVDALTAKYDDYLEKYGSLKAEAGKLEEDLNAARAMQSLIRYPDEAKDLPLDHDILMINAVMNHCRVKGLNPKITLKDVVGAKYSNIILFSEVELSDLLEWALKGVQKSISPDTQ